MLVGFNGDMCQNDGHDLGSRIGCLLSSLATTAEVIPLDEVQRALDAGTVGQSQRVVISEDGTQRILEEVGPDLRTGA